MNALHKNAAAAVLCLLAVTVVMAQVPPFKPPSADEQLKAIGSTAGLPEPLRRALDVRHFKIIPAPGPNDWLANHAEAGQTFDQFVRSQPNRPNARLRKIYLQPLGIGGFRKDDTPPLDRLREFAVAFFMMEVELLPPLDISQSHVTTRRNPQTDKVQLLTGDILKLLGQRLPTDAFALLGITMEDLYPRPEWNFVFGEASLRERVAVYSFARYDPRFYGAVLSPDGKELLLRRSYTTLAHEASHMFGIEHCIYYHCLMNGSNHLVESDARPLHLCPVDLRKLQDSVRFDIVERYRRLRSFCQSMGLKDEAQWLSQQ